MAFPIHDAHNHLHDQRLRGRRLEILNTLDTEGLTTAIVNGTSENDWPAVQALTEEIPSRLRPCFGLHPWFVKERSPEWKDRLVEALETTKNLRPGIGEVGLDKWIRGHDIKEQSAVFVDQLRIAAERRLPVTIHCLQAWGTLVEILEREPVPECGFLLHAYGGPAELVDRLADLGAYFSFNGYFLHERKRAQREVFRSLPPDRLLVETDAPDMPPPPELSAYPLSDDGSGRPINHPGNIRMIYEALARLREISVEALASRVDENFKRLFG